MIKRTLYFGNSAYLSKKDDQLVIRLPEVEKNQTLPETFKKEAHATVPIEDIGVVVLDNQQVIITHALLSALIDNNVAVITCNDNHMPSSLFMPLSANTEQNERFRNQLNASEPLKKNLWQQTVEAKIRNQAFVLKKRGIKIDNMLHWVESVKSGDTENHEARAAAYYWSNILPAVPDFRRRRDGIPPNNIFNYSYAILRAVVARGLAASGLLPTLGIHHHNRYNAYCLADDIMEPYRPYADEIVCKIVDTGIDLQELSPTLKKELLIIPALDIFIDGESSPLMVGLQKTTASLVKCFEGETRKIVYPEMT